MFYVGCLTMSKGLSTVWTKENISIGDEDDGREMLAWRFLSDLHVCHKRRLDEIFSLVIEQK